VGTTWHIYKAFLDIERETNAGFRKLKSFREREREEEEETLG
jgi:hypothetical protein